MSWDSVGHSIERDIQRAAILVAAGLVTLGGVIGMVVDALWRRHRR